MKVLICGGRDFDDYGMVKRAMSALKVIQGPISEIIHGAARGADSLGGRYARENGIPCREFPADWNRHGRSAGPIRNRVMLKEGDPDIVVAFPGGKGTADMIDVARANGVKVWEPPPLP